MKQLHTQVSPSLVTYEQFADFIRTERYFNPKLWENLAPAPKCGGDEVLRRIEFYWDDRHQPVVGVSWLEAATYCKAYGGRLPWRQEILAQRQLLPPGRRIPAEWCGDWYNPFADGELVRPDPPPRRRVEGWEEHECAVPDLTGEPIGFRVVREQTVRSHY